MEQIWFRNDEVQILVVDLRQMFSGSRSYRLCTEVFEEGSGYAGEEVQVGRTWMIMLVNHVCFSKMSVY